MRRKVIDLKKKNHVRDRLIRQNKKGLTGTKKTNADPTWKRKTKGEEGEGEGPGGFVGAVRRLGGSRIMENGRKGPSRMVHWST